MQAAFNLVPANSPELVGRIPSKMMVDAKGNIFFRWIYIGSKKFEEPFFSESLLTCLSLPQNSNMPYTTAETLLEKARDVDAVAPSAFIFHISRCGSTLLSQMLCCDERMIVLSEVPLLDEILRLPFSHPDKEFSVQQLYFALLKLLGQKRSGKEEFLFIKTDSWHLHFFETLRNYFPKLPFLLLYRSPQEVIRSQQKQRGMHALTGLLEPQIFGHTQEELLQRSMDKHLEMVLEGYFEKMLSILATDKNSTPISYHEGAMAMMQAALETCRISISPETFAAIKIRTQTHSKNPSHAFSPEEIIPPAASSHLEKLFDHLNARRIDLRCET